MSHGLKPEAEQPSVQGTQEKKAIRTGYFVASTVVYSASGFNPWQNRGKR